MSRANSTAGVWLEELRKQQDPVKFLIDIPTRPDPFFEEEWIDFKGNPKDDNDLKRIWSKALSGYANIIDGLVVWGIDARRTPPRNIDAACGLNLIPDPHALESRLRTLARTATNPPVMGLEYQSYQGPTGGFVVCLIPESGHRPHRAEFADNRYYYRAGDHFRQAEPGLLRVLFYPKFNARFRLSARLSMLLTSQGPETKARLRSEISLINDGTASASDVVIVANHTINQQWYMAFSPSQYWKQSAVSSTIVNKATLQCQIPIHPGFPSQVFTIDWKPSGFSPEGYPLFPEHVINLYIYAKDMEYAQYESRFRSSDLAGPDTCEKLFDLKYPISNP